MRYELTEQQLLCPGVAAMQCNAVTSAPSPTVSDACQKELQRTVLSTSVFNPAKKSKQSSSLGDKNPQTNSGRAAFQDEMTPRRRIHRMKRKRFVELCFDREGFQVRQNRIELMTRCQVQSAL
jgi:hypothetical protein